MSRFFRFSLQPFPLLLCLGSQFCTGRAPKPGEEHGFHPSGHLFLLSTRAIPVGPKMLFQHRASEATCQPVLSETPTLHTASPASPALQSSHTTKTGGPLSRPHSAVVAGARRQSTAQSCTGSVPWWYPSGDLGQKQGGSQA